MILRCTSVNYELLRRGIEQQMPKIYKDTVVFNGINAVVPHTAKTTRSLLVPKGRSLACHISISQPV